MRQTAAEKLLEHAEEDLRVLEQAIREALVAQSLDRMRAQDDLAVKRSERDAARKLVRFARRATGLRADGSARKAT